jgi:hypothetical protein
MMLIYIGRKPNSVKKDIESLLVASKETGLDLNAYKSWYMFMSRDRNAGQIYNINNDKESCERV